MAGINRALYENRHLAKDSAGKPCIFLSHISVDKSAAMALANYITKNGDIDIYLDVNDGQLQQAAASGNASRITQFIEEGLSHSTHIMCLVSADTAKSWWVPYELGFAKRAGKNLSTFKLKGEISLPAYLQISQIILGTKSLNEYLAKLHEGFSKTAYRSLADSLIPYSTQGHPLDQYFDWNA